MGKKQLAVNDVLFSSKHSLYVSSLLDNVKVHNRYAVAGILCELSRIMVDDGIPMNTEIILLPGYNLRMIDYKLEIEGFCELAKNFIKETEDGVEIKSFFITGNVEMQVDLKRKGSALRQKRYRERRKEIPRPVKTTPVKTEIKSVAKPDKPVVKNPAKEKGPPDEPHYRTYKGFYLTGQAFEWWQMFWKAWGSYGVKSEAAESFRVHYKKKVINANNIQLICDAAAHERRGRAQVIAKKSTPKYPQGWLTGCRWEIYEELLKSGKIIGVDQPIEKRFPENWKVILAEMIYKDYPDLIKKFESGEYKTPGDMPHELQTLVLKKKTF